MSNETESIQGPTAIRDRIASLQPHQLVPGTLTQWSDSKESSDRYWEFVGDGRITSTEFAATALQREIGQGEQNLKEVNPHDAQGMDFSRYAAQKLLSDRPDEPIPRGQVKELSVKDLIKLVEPFLRNYAKSVQAQEGVMGGSSKSMGAQYDANPTLGRVASQGLYVPLELEPGFK